MICKLFKMLDAHKPYPVAAESGRHVTASTASACSEVSSVDSGLSGARRSLTSMPSYSDNACTAVETEKG
jgi:hypothetical protein